MIIGLVQMSLDNNLTTNLDKSLKYCDMATKINTKQINKLSLYGVNTSGLKI